MGKKQARQKALVVAHLKSNGTITSAEAWNIYGISRLSAVIWGLRHDDGYEISTTTVHTRNRYNDPCSYAVYRFKQGT